MAQLSAQGPIGLPCPTSEVLTDTTPLPIKVGTRARDESGNEYVFLRYSTAVFAEQPVEISDWSTAAVLGTTGRGPLGVVCTSATSDQAGWVQIYGLANIMLGMSGVSPSDAAAGPTTLSTTAQTRFLLGSSLSSPNGIGYSAGNVSTASGFFVEGMKVAKSADLTAVTAVTSGTSHTGGRVLVQLNYPEIRHINFGE